MFHYGQSKNISSQKEKADTFARETSKD